MSEWESDGRPIYDRLPAFHAQYRGSSIVDAVTTPWDALLVEAKEILETFGEIYLNPESCPNRWLDWLAQLVGFTGEYWSPSWDDAVKRQLITDAHTKIWPHKGTRWLLGYLFEVHDIPATVRIPGEFLAGLNACGDELGGDRLTYYLVFDASGPIERNDPKWRLAAQLDRLYMPVWIDRGGTDASGNQGSAIQFDQFVAGFSVCGDRLL